jgi:methylenetetrahydrofolate dehydrogenase (NADP+)/methenyltetrahydrofolate cyclohydrolase
MMILDGKMYAQQSRQKLKSIIEQNNLSPTLCIINIGDDAASQIYVRNKEKACQEVGISCIIQHFEADVTEQDVLNYINQVNNNPSIDALMVQLPIPQHLNTDKIINSIAPEKDVDGLTYINAGKLQHKSVDALVPCTPLGIIKLLKHYNIDLCGKHCVVIGRSNIVGKPLAELLINEDATVTVCHSKTKDLCDITRDADIVIAALGKPNFIKGYFINDGAVVIDVGINRTENGLCGDVDFEDVKSKCSYITPVPGGVGPMTVAMLLNNVVVAATRNWRNNQCTYV